MSRLRDTFAGCDPEATFELLSYWMLRAAEKKALITKKEVAARVQAVGAFVQNRAAYHREAESIIPLVDEQPGHPKGCLLSSIEASPRVSNTYKPTSTFRANTGSAISNAHTKKLGVSS